MSAIAAGPRQTKFVLDESRIPRSWYNIAADLPEPAPPVLHPGTGQPIGPGDLAPLFPMEPLAGALLAMLLTRAVSRRDPAA